VKNIKYPVNDKLYNEARVNVIKLVEPYSSRGPIRDQVWRNCEVVIYQEVLSPVREQIENEKFVA